MPKRVSAVARQRARQLCQGPTIFTCGICLENFNHITPSVKILSDQVCESCFITHLRPQFIAASQSEWHYPVRWGGKELEIEPYPVWFSSKFMRKWKDKQVEYGTAAAERLYCRGVKRTSACGAYLCPRQAHRSGRVCNECRFVTCVKCEATSDNVDILKNHICDAIIKEEASDASDAFKGLERGKDYQRCPSCRTPIELRDGCNHVICRAGRCTADFCFLCGNFANMLHWRPGRNCPLYGRPKVPLTNVLLGPPQPPQDDQVQVHVEEVEGRHWGRSTVSMLVLVAIACAAVGWYWIVGLTRKGKSI